MDAILYLEHLSDADLALLAGVSGHASAGDLISYLHANPGYVETLLGDPALYRTLFAAAQDEALLRASPFLIFAVLIHRATADLDQTSFIQEWIGPGRRVPMFEVAALRSFAADATRRLFLAELLASYTRVASGSFWLHTSRGWRRHRYSELDPLRLIELLEVVPACERPAIYRRLGDLALFLTGVFPDYAGRRFLMPIPRARLQRAISLERIEGNDDQSIWLLEELGRRSYHLAWQAAEEVSGAGPRILGDIAAGFGEARRTLNFLTDGYLFPHRERWFPVGG